MRTLGALIGATLAGSAVYALYNLLLEPYVPDVPIIQVKRQVQTPEGVQVIPVSYLDLDHVVAVAAIALAAVPIGAMIHKVSGGLVPAAK